MLLTPNAITLISKNSKSHPNLKNPVLQIISFDKHLSPVNDLHRIKANLSDGTHYIKSIFSTKYTKHFENLSMKTNSIITVSNFEVRGKENVFLYVTEIMDYKDCKEMIGNPKNISGRKEIDSKDEVFSRQNSVNLTKDISENKQVSNNNNLKVSNNNLGVKNEVVDKNNIYANSKQNNVNDFPPKTSNSVTNFKNNNPNMHNESNLRKSSEDRNSLKRPHTGQITPINSLNPFIHNYEIKGRCLSKSDIKTFTNQKGEGKLFSFILADSTGTIKLVAFSECVDMLFSLVDINKVYNVSGGVVRMANKKFGNTTSDYEIQMDKTTKINLVYDEDAPKYYFKFVKIQDLSVDLGMVDIVGVVKDIYETSKITVKSTGKENSKRDLNLIDKTGLVRVTLWGKNAESEINAGDCVVLSNMMVKEYNGITLSSSSSSSVHVNLMIDECYELKGWYEEIGKTLKFERKMKDDFKLVSDIKENEIKFSQFIGTVVFVKEDALFYNSCIDCNKKVIDEDGVFRCEKCNTTNENCNIRYLARFEVGDFTEMIWINAFDDQCKQMIGVEAKDFEPQYVKDLYFKDFMFKTIMKSENYQGEMRNKYNVREVKEVNYGDEAKRLLKCIKESV